MRRRWLWTMLATLALAACGADEGAPTGGGLDGSADVTAADAASGSDGGAGLDAGSEGRDGDAADGATACKPTAPVLTVGGVEVGGSNYVLTSAGDYLKTPTEAVWYSAAGVKPVIGTYHLAQAAVRAQLAQMAAAGQRKIALMLWYAPFSSGVGVDGVYGHVVDRNGGALLPRHAANLKALLADIVCAGYQEVQLRFATQGGADPGTWSAWDEASYQANWNLVASVTNVARAALAGTAVALWTDIAVELGGIETGQSAAYVKRLWQDYTFTFGAAGTVGASFAAAPGRLPKAIALYDQTGSRPPAYAFDIYDGAGAMVDTLAAELGAAGEKGKPVVVQEAYYDDAIANAQLRARAAAGGLRLRTIMQWPIARGAASAHFSMDYPRSYASYLSP